MYDSTAFNIANFVNDGFKKVCHVGVDAYDHWLYYGIDKSVMFDYHKSWVYFIVANNQIVKVGESGNPLGIESTRDWYRGEVQPITGTKSRFGRLRKGDGTDEYIRESLNSFIKKNVPVTLWAKKCPITTINESVGGRKTQVLGAHHKDLEQEYLSYFESKAGRFPDLNKARK